MTWFHLLAASYVAAVGFATITEFYGLMLHHQRLTEDMRNANECAQRVAEQVTANGHVLQSVGIGPEGQNGCSVEVHDSGGTMDVKATCKDATCELQIPEH